MVPLLTVTTPLEDRLNLLKRRLSILEGDSVDRNISLARVNDLGDTGSSYTMAQPHHLGDEMDSGDTRIASTHVDTDRHHRLPSSIRQDFDGFSTTPATSFANADAHTTTPQDLNVRLLETYPDAPLQTVAYLRNTDSMTASNSTMGKCDPVARGVLSLSELKILFDM